MLRGTFSQRGEDKVVLDYFGGRPGVYVDVGANYPINISDTYLLYRHGWRGLTVEPIPRLSLRHRRFRPDDEHVCAAVAATPGEITFYEMDSTGLSTFDPARVKEAEEAGARLRCEYKLPLFPLGELVSRSLGEKSVDFLSVDTEGHDLSVLQSADWDRFRPKLIIHEIDGQGSPEVADFPKSRGYRCYRTLGCNVIMELA
jgi:FkbM family methyltransferase